MLALTQRGFSGKLHVPRLHTPGHAHIPFLCNHSQRSCFRSKGLGHLAAGVRAASRGPGGLGCQGDRAVFGGVSGRVVVVAAAVVVVVVVVAAASSSSKQQQQQQE